jgi:hypothetical protein
MTASTYLIKAALQSQAVNNDPLQDKKEKRKDLIKGVAALGGLSGAVLSEPLAAALHERMLGNSPAITREEVNVARKAMGVKPRVYLSTETWNPRESAHFLPGGEEQGPLLKADPVSVFKTNKGLGYVRKLNIPEDLANHYLENVGARRIQDQQQGWVTTEPNRAVALHEMGHAQSSADEGRMTRTLHGLSHKVFPYVGGVAGGMLAGGSDPNRRLGSSLLRGFAGGALGGLTGGLPILVNEGKASWLGAQQAGKMFGPGAKLQTLKDLTPAFGTYLSRYMILGALSGSLSSGVVRQLRMALLKRKKEKDERERQLSGQ